MSLLNVRNLKVYFPIRSGLLSRSQFVKAVDGVSFDIEQGEALGLVGESGSGKTTVGRAILRLISQAQGEIYFENKELLSLKEKEIQPLRKNMQIIFQDPFSSLNPRMTLGNILEEGLLIHRIGNRENRKKQVIEILEKVGLNRDYINRYPHEFSGGQRQRIGIARALILKPKLIICDEPVSALDVSIQVQVLKLMQKLQKDFQLTYLFIAHDLTVVDYFCKRILILYLGKVMELGDRDSITSRPLHPYTQALMDSIPLPDPEKSNSKTVLEGDIPSPIQPPSGCVFHTRCPKAEAICRNVIPPLEEIRDGHFCACHLVKKGKI